jgi:hypothetical protein
MEDLETALVLIVAIAAGLAGVYLTHRAAVRFASKDAPEPTRDITKRCPGCDSPEELNMEFCPVCGRKYDRS